MNDVHVHVARTIYYSPTYHFEDANATFRTYMLKKIAARKVSPRDKACCPRRIPADAPSASTVGDTKTEPMVQLAADFSHAGALLQNAPARHMLHDPPCCMCCAASRRGTLVASSRQQGHATQKSHNSHIHEYATQCLMHFRRFHEHLPETL